LTNTIAPEHVELIVRQPGKWARGIRNAGAMFLGPYSAPPLGDYLAGPNHVLPTGGSARSFHRWVLTTFSNGRRLFTPKKGRSALWRRRLLNSRGSKASTTTLAQSKRGSNKRREHGTDGKN